MENNNRFHEVIMVLLGVILGGLIGISGIILENELSRESVESELIVIDMHFEKLEDLNNTAYKNFTFEKINANYGVNLTFLEINISIVNSAYSKYPLKLRSSYINHIIEKDENQYNPQNHKINYEDQQIKLDYLSSIRPYSLNIDPADLKDNAIFVVNFNMDASPVFPSKERTITIHDIVVSQGEINVTTMLIISYYDPLKDEIKELSDVVCTLHIKNGNVEYITPLKEYVTVKGFGVDDNAYYYHG